MQKLRNALFDVRIAIVFEAHRFGYPRFLMIGAFAIQREFINFHEDTCFRLGMPPAKLFSSGLAVDRPHFDVLQTLGVRRHVVNFDLQGMNATNSEPTGNFALNPCSFSTRNSSATGFVDTK